MKRRRRGVELTEDEKETKDGQEAKIEE
jgi:hypothetical protein